MSSYYSPSGSFSSSSSIASTSFNNKTNKTKTNKTSKSVMRLSTDPQSVAARHRRHRISDRFKILQSLVPGGSKLDTVSMLEEAIRYVQFLKTQILLHQSLDLIISSSDAPAPDQKCGAGMVNDQRALAECGNYEGESEVDFGSNDDFFAQMQLSELPEGYFHHFQGQECNFNCGSQYFEY